MTSGRSKVYSALIGSCALGALAFATPAHAVVPIGTCTGTVQGHTINGTITGDNSNLQCLIGTSDNQVEDADDVKMFVDKNTSVPVGTILFGSLNGNSNSLQNIQTTANGEFETDGSGFANFKAVVPAGTSNTLTSYSFAPGPDSGPGAVMANGQPFPGFDGEAFRGQIDDVDGYNGDLTITINFSDLTSDTISFDGLSASSSQDFGALGFDEITDPGVFITSVNVSLDGTGGAFGELKQIVFSVPGATPVPESSTWAMMMLGFAGLGYAAFRRNAKLRLQA